MKKILQLIILVCFLSGFKINLIAQNPIDRNLFGQNSWYVNINDPINLDQYWTVIQESGVTNIRIGGIQPNWDWNQLTSSSYANLKELVKKIRQHHIEPIVQVGFDPFSGVPIATQASDAAGAVQNLNTDPDPEYHVTYWIISNEPDGNYVASNPHANGFGYSGATGADLIEDYMRLYWQQMKGVQGGSNIKIIGPELTSCWGTSPIFLELTNSSNSATNIIPYIDIFSFHMYPFGNENKTQVNYDIPSTWSNVQNYLSGLPSPAVYANTFDSHPLRNVLSDIRARLDANGGGTKGIAITEANICHENNVSSDDATNGINATTEANDLTTGTGTNGFIAGQFWAETMAECLRANDPTAVKADVRFLNFWSILQGDQTPFEKNIGYLNAQAGGVWGASGAKKSTYQHFKMMANYFKGNFYTGAISGGGSTGIKAFASYDGNHIAVMILNQQDNSNADRSFTVDLNGGASGSDINIDLAMGVSATNYAASGVPNQKIENMSTVLLLFDCKGNFSGRYDYKQSSATSDPLYTPASPANPLFNPVITLTSPQPPLTAGINYTFTLSSNPTYTYTWSTTPSPYGQSIPNHDQVDLTSPNAGAPDNVYTYTVSDAQGCTFTSGITLLNNGTVVGTNDPPDYFYPSLINVHGANCNTNDGGYAIFNTSGCNGSLTYSWDDGQPQSSPYSANLSAGTHTVVLTCHYNGIFERKVPLTVYIPGPGLPAIHVGDDRTICQGTSTQLNTILEHQGPVTYTYSWSPTTGLSNPNIPNPVASPSVTTSYTLTLTYQGNPPNPCKIIDVVTINVVPLPQFNVSGSTTSCGSAAYGVSPHQAGLNYSWATSTGLSGNTYPAMVDFSTTGGGTITYNAISSEGCSSNASLNVTGFIPPQVYAGPDMIICNGSSSTIQAIISGGGASPTYSWSPASGLSSPTILNPIANPNSTTVYTLTVTGASGCPSTDSVTITKAIPPMLNVIPEREICQGASVTLNGNFFSGNPNSVINWSPAVGLSSTGILNPVANPDATTIYTVSVTDGNGCSDQEFVTVKISPPISFQITGSTTSCVGATNYSVSPVQNGVTYSWTSTSGASGTGSSSNIDIPDGGGTITFTGAYTDPKCSSFSSSLYIGSCCIPAITTQNFINSSTSAMSASGIGTNAGGVFTVSNKTISINGTFTVNQNMTIRGCVLKMGYLSKIVVNPGIALTITNFTAPTHIYACNEMWDGIYAATSNSTVTINNGTTIEDALNAVYSDKGGVINITSSPAFGNVMFNKNLKSIVINNATGIYPGYVRATTFKSADGLTGGNPNATQGKLRYPYGNQHANTGVEIFNVSDITIGSYQNPTMLNTFTNLDFGIVSLSSTLKVYNNNFTNIILPAGQPARKEQGECSPGTAICSYTVNFATNSIILGGTTSPFQKNTFTNCNIGMSATRGMSVSAVRNTFTDVSGTGIRTSNNTSRSITINENVISNSGVAIDCYNNIGSNIIIDNNDIDAGSLQRASGIIVNEVLMGTAVYKISSNTIRNVRYGVFANGLKNSVIDQNVVYLKHTTSGKYYCYGIGLVKSEACKIVANWVQGQNSNDYWVDGIFIDNSVTNYVTCNESHTVGSGMFFGGVQTPNTYIAKNTMDNNLWGMVINYGVVGPQKTVSGSTTKPNDNRWMGGFTSGCYTLSYNSDGSLSPFYVRPTAQYDPGLVTSHNCYSSGTAIPFYPISGSLSPLFCPLTLVSLNASQPSVRSLLLQIAGDSITPPAYIPSTKEMLKQSLYKYLLVDSSLIPSEPLLGQFITSATSGVIGKLNAVEKGLSNPIGAVPSALPALKTLNNSVSPLNDVQINSKGIYNVIINNLINGASYSDTQLADLRILAAKCPYNDGYAVYQARAILSQYDITEYRNVCENVLPEVGRRMINNDEVNESPINEFLLFPNPNSGNMNFVYSLNEGSSGEMFIYDLSGRIISKYILKTGNKNEMIINETELNNGIYFYKVIIDGELKASDKMVIIK